MARVLDLEPNNLETDEPRGLKFCRELKHQKIFDTCPGVFQNLYQGPDEALKIVFLNMNRTLEGINLWT